LGGAKPQPLQHDVRTVEPQVKLFGRNKLFAKFESNAFQRITRAKVVIVRRDNDVIIASDRDDCGEQFSGNRIPQFDRRIPTSWWPTRGEWD